MLRARLDRRARTDPELEHLAERAFGELRQVPLVRPSRDLADAVKQRLQQADDARPAADTDQPGTPRD